MQLIDTDGNVIDEWTSSDTPHVISQIPCGGYTLKEIAAPDGYVIATDIQFTIDENGSVTVDGVKANAYNSDGVPCITMVDKAVDKPVTPPPTGDAGRSPMGLAMVIAGLCGVFYVSYKYRKMTKEKGTLHDDYSDLCPNFVEGTENE